MVGEPHVPTRREGRVPCTKGFLRLCDGIAAARWEHGMIPFVPSCAPQESTCVNIAVDCSLVCIYCIHAVIAGWSGFHLNLNEGRVGIISSQRTKE